MRSLRDKACIVGVGQTAYTRGPLSEGRNNLTLQLEASVAAIADAGLANKQIDAVLPIVGLGIAEDFAINLGIEDLRYQATSHLGGASPGASLLNAVMAVTCGIANYVLVPGGWYGYSGCRVRELVVSDTSWSGGANTRDYNFPYGLSVPPQWFSFMARRHMSEFGTKAEHMGAVAIAMRKHAQLNPAAIMCGRPITMEDYMASPMISDPYRMLDCSLEADGAAAFVVTTAERAADLKQRPVYVSGIAQGQPYPADNIVARKDFFRLGAAHAAPRAFSMAGITPHEVDFAEVYDPFTFQVIQQLEDIGFCKRGEGGPFVEGGRIELGGELPINTHGGLLSEAHIVGMNHFVEAVIQLRGTAGQRQVRNATVGVVTGFGDLGDSAIAILRNDQ